MSIELQEVQCISECNLWLSCENAKRGANKIPGEMYQPDKDGCKAFVLRKELSFNGDMPKNLRGQRKTRNFSPQNNERKMGWDPMTKRHIVNGVNIKED